MATAHKSSTTSVIPATEPNEPVSEFGLENLPPHLLHASNAADLLVGNTRMVWMALSAALTPGEMEDDFFFLVREGLTNLREKVQRCEEDIRRCRERLVRARNRIVNAPATGKLRASTGHELSILYYEDLEWCLWGASMGCQGPYGPVPEAIRPVRKRVPIEFVCKNLRKLAKTIAGYRPTNQIAGAANMRRKRIEALKEKQAIIDEKQEIATNILIQIEQELIEATAMEAKSVDQAQEYLDLKSRALPEPAEAEDPAPPSNRLTVEEANTKAKRLAKQMGNAFFLLSERKQFKLIGCGSKTWRNTELYKKAKKMKAKVLRPSKQGQTRSPAAMSFTSTLEAQTYDGERDEEIKRLIEDQEADQEPSPLDDDLPDSRPRKVHSRKRL